MAQHVSPLEQQVTFQFNLSYLPPFLPAALFAPWPCPCEPKSKPNDIMNDLLPQLFACSSSPLAATLPVLPLMSGRGRGAVQEAVGRAAALNY